MPITSKAFPTSTPFFDAQGHVSRPIVEFFNDLSVRADRAAAASSGSAPNGSATAEVYFQFNGNASQLFGFRGTITLPAQRGGLHAVTITAVAPDGAGTVLATYSEPFSADTIDYAATVGTQPDADQPGWSVTFVGYDIAGNSSAPFIVDGLTVYAAQVSSVVFSEEGPRYPDEHGVVRSLFSVAPAVEHGEFPINVSIWIDFDDGLGWINQGWKKFADEFDTWEIDHWVPTATSETSWKVAVAPGTFDLSAGPPVSAVQDALTVAAVGAPSATGVNSAEFVVDPITAALLSYAVNSVGIQTFWFHRIEWTQPTAVEDPNYWYSMICVQKGYASSGNGTVTLTTHLHRTTGRSFTADDVGKTVHFGATAGEGQENTIASFTDADNVVLTNPVTNASAVWEIWNPAPDREGIDQHPGIFHGRQIADSGEVQGNAEKNSIPGTVVGITGDAPDAWTMPSVHNDDGTDNLYVTFRFWIYSGSRLLSNPLGGTLVLQATAWAGYDHIDLTPTNLSNPLDLRQTNVHSISSTLGFDAGQKLGHLGIQVVISLPTLPSAYYPAGSIVQLSATGKFYINHAGAWESTQDPTKMLTGALTAGVTIAAAYVTAGTLVAGVVYAGSISATQITSGNLTVAGTGANMGTIICLDAANATTAWIGNLTGGYYGAWLKNAYIGGGSPSTALVTIVGSSGAITACTLALNVGGIITKIDNGTAYAGYQGGLTITDTPGLHGTLFAGASNLGSAFGIVDSGGTRVSLSYAWGGDTNLTMLGAGAGSQPVQVSSGGSFSGLQISSSTGNFTIDGVAKSISIPSGWGVLVNGTPGYTGAVAGRSCVNGIVV